jgi:hypothetical protein
MATVHTSEAALVFGVPDGEEGSLITHKVSATHKTKKKDLRGRLGGYKAVTSYGDSVEASIDGTIVGGTVAATLALTGFTLGAVHTLVNDALAVGYSFYVESVSLNEKNEDYATASVKLFGVDV